MAAAAEEEKEGRWVKADRRTQGQGPGANTTAASIPSAVIIGHNMRQKNGEWQQQQQQQNQQQKQQQKGEAADTAEFIVESEHPVSGIERSDRAPAWGPPFSGECFYYALLRLRKDVSPEYSPAPPRPRPMRMERRRGNMV